MGEVHLSEEKQSYVQHMNILYEPLQRIDIQSLVSACSDPWYNQTLCQVNDSVVRLGILHGDLYRLIGVHRRAIGDIER